MTLFEVFPQTARSLSWSTIGTQLQRVVGPRNECVRHRSRNMRARGRRGYLFWTQPHQPCKSVGDIHRMRAPKAGGFEFITAQPFRAWFELEDDDCEIARIY